MRCAYFIVIFLKTSFYEYISLRAFPLQEMLSSKSIKLWQPLLEELKFPEQLELL
jgi:hypothetical protein